MITEDIRAKVAEGHTLTQEEAQYLLDTIKEQEYYLDRMREEIDELEDEKP